MSVFTPAPETTAPRRTWRRPKRSSARPVRRASTHSFDSLLSSAAVTQAQGRRWKRAYHRRVLAVDIFVIVMAIAAAQVGARVLIPADQSAGYVGWRHMTLLSGILVVCWLLALDMRQSRDISLVGVGAEEYRRVVSTTAWVFGLFAVTCLLLDVRVARGYLGLALVLGLIGLVGGRYCIRRNLARRRLRGEFITKVVVLGSPASVRLLCRSFGRSAAAGYQVVGACVPQIDPEVGEELELVTATGIVPVLGDHTSVERGLRLTGADVLAVAAADHLGPEKMKELLWRLESLGTDLVVVPAVTDIAGPRLQIRPIDNLPLFHIAPARQDAPAAAEKRIFDLVVGMAALLVAVPIMLLAALAIKLDDGGPVFFSQVRVGHRGRPFRIFKFRTMTVDAEAKKDEERAAVGCGGVFYKSASDSRITRVGRILRKTSVDELPQLLNVLGGSMSIVGPRPLVPGEGESVEHFLERRGLVKPGITGLWQVSGRSNVTEDERIRLDYSYVDNWSCGQDFVIVGRTIRTVLGREGAY